MIANYGYEDGSGFYYITIDGDVCARLSGSQLRGGLSAEGLRYRDGRLRRPRGRGGRERAQASPGALLSLQGPRRGREHPGGAALHERLRGGALRHSW